MIHSSSHPRYPGPWARILGLISPHTKAHEPAYQGRNKQTEIHYNNFVYNRLISKNKYRWLVRNPRRRNKKDRHTLSGGWFNGRYNRPSPFYWKDNEAFICIQITSDKVRSIGESLSFISESITGPSVTDTFIKRENATLIYNRRDTPREIVTTQVSTECIPFHLTIQEWQEWHCIQPFLIS